jgi:hypothetical protein
MSTNEITSRNERPRDALVTRYSDASDTVDEAPNPRVRAAVLAEAHRLAREQRAPKQVTAFTKKRAANDGQWRFAAAASVVMAGLAVFIVNRWDSGETELMVTQTPNVASANAAEQAGATATAPKNASTDAAAGAATVDTTRSAATSSDAVATLKNAPAATEEKIDLRASSVAEKSERSVSSSTITSANVAKRHGGDKIAEEMSSSASARAQASPVATAKPAVRSEQVDVIAAAPLPLPSPAIASAPPAAPARPASPTANATAAAAPSIMAAPSSATRERLAEPAIATARTAEPEQREVLREKKQAFAAIERSTANLAKAASAAADAAGGASAPGEPAVARRVGEMTPETQRGTAAMRATSSLREAVRNNDLVSARAALRQQADVNVTDRNGVSLVTQAVRSGNVELVVELVRAGADVDRRDSAGLSARDYAERSGNRAIIELIVK